MGADVNKEQWIQGVMNSTTGMKRAHPATGLYEKIVKNIGNTPTAKAISIPIKQWAAAAILLLALNIGSVLYFTNRNNEKGKTISTNALAAAMQPGTTYNY